MAHQDPRVRNNVSSEVKRKIIHPTVVQCSPPYSGKEFNLEIGKILLKSPHINNACTPTTKENLNFVNTI